MNMRETRGAGCRRLPITGPAQTEKDRTMPMIDVYAPTGVIGDPHTLATELARTIMRWEKVPAIPFFTDNTAAFVHELPAAAISTAGGSSDHVRVQVTTNAGALDRDQQLGVVKDITALVAEAAGDPSLAERTWVSLTEAVPGGWGIGGHAYTNDEIVQHVRSLLGKA
jgi:phenylpyruvate tautomerase PptA (4-oxalocrotonate tautomerase family)